jgi:hypothetical protein
MSVYLVEAPISIDFDLYQDENPYFLREYYRFGQAEDDPISKWLQVAKSKGEAGETDPVLLHLVMELHKKVDKIEQILKNESPDSIKLAQHQEIQSIGFEHFLLPNTVLEPGQEYYGRIGMPVHPRREIAFFFEAESSSLAKIIRMQDRDQKDWNLYVRSCERILLKERKGRQA